MGIGFIRLTNSDMESRGADRSAGGGFDAYDQSISLAFAGRGGNYNIGIGGK